MWLVSLRHENFHYELRIHESRKNNPNCINTTIPIMWSYRIDDETNLLDSHAFCVLLWLSIKFWICSQSLLITGLRAYDEWLRLWAADIGYSIGHLSIMHFIYLFLHLCLYFCLFHANTIHTTHGHGHGHAHAHAHINIDWCTMFLRLDKNRHGLLWWRQCTMCRTQYDARCQNQKDHINGSAVVQSVTAI